VFICAARLWTEVPFEVVLPGIRARARSVTRLRTPPVVFRISRE